MNVIILSVEISFSEWLQREIDQRGWSWNKLAEMAGLSSGTIYNIRDGIRGVGEASVTAIARALRLPTDEVFRAAGLLPPDREIDAVEQEILHLYRLVPPDKQQQLLEYARFLVAQAESEEKRKKR